MHLTTDRAPSRDEVRVYGADLAAPPLPLESLEASLSPEEHERAARFRFARDQRRFVTARGLLRHLLGDLLDTTPAKIAFSVGALGKPALFPTPGPETLRFNLSHADDVALFAVARGHEVGVDVERIRDDLPVAEIAGRFFSPEECFALQELPPEERQETFFAYWTAKEAYVKAHGDGLHLALDQFTVRLAGEASALLRLQGDVWTEDQGWSLHLLPAPTGYRAAVVIEAGEGIESPSVKSLAWLR